jgi:hypothetical protein
MTATADFDTLPDGTFLAAAAQDEEGYVANILPDYPHPHEVSAIHPDFEVEDGVVDHQRWS